MADLTLLDIAKLNGNDKVVGLIEEAIAAAPELSVFGTRQIAGTNYYTVKRTGNPSVSFRGANEGVTPSKSSFAKQLVECFVLSAAAEVDLAVAAAYEGGAAALEMVEAAGVMRQALIEIADQIWYGVTTDAKGFAGLKAATAAGGDYALNASGDASGAVSSVYAVRFGVQDLQLVVGNGTTFELSAFRDQQLTDATTTTKRYAGRVADLTAWVGLQIGHNNCVRRLYNVDDYTGTSATWATDAWLARLIDMFPVGYAPSALFMTRRTRAQLQSTRSVTIYSQAGVAPKGGAQGIVAPTPTEAFGIPIYVTDSILNTDTVGT